MCIRDRLKVRTDTERFINAFINILFSSLVGVGFLTWYSVTKHWALVPVFLFGAGRREVHYRIHSLADITPAILSYLAG